MNGSQKCLLNELEGCRKKVGKREGEERRGKEGRTDRWMDGRTGKNRKRTRKKWKKRMKQGRKLPAMAKH